MKTRPLPFTGILVMFLAMAPTAADGGANGRDIPEGSVAETIDVHDTKPQIAGLDLQPEGQRIQLSFRLLNAFDEELQQRLDSGLPTGFGYTFQLLKDRRSWFDKSLASGNLRVDAMFNAVTGEYLINFKHDGNLIESKVVREPDELEKALTEFTLFPAFSVDDEDMGQRLRVRVRADLGTKHVFFFIPRRLSTDWAESERFEITPDAE